MPTFESEDDRLALLTELGDDVTYTPLGGAAKTIQGMVDDESENVRLDDGSVVAMRPAILCRTSDLTGTVLGGAIVYDGTTYTIKEDLPDGTGMTSLTLEEA